MSKQNVGIIQWLAEFRLKYYKYIQNTSIIYRQLSLCKEGVILNRFNYVLYDRFNTL